jgi:hypothetical protein
MPRFDSLVDITAMCGFEVDLRKISHARQNQSARHENLGPAVQFLYPMKIFWCNDLNCTGKAREPAPPALVLALCF